MGTDLQVTSGERRIARRRGLGRSVGHYPALRPAIRPRSGAVGREQVADDVYQRPPRPPRLGADPVERLAVDDLVSLHEDSIRALDLRPALEVVQQLGELAVALERDADPALQLGLV